MVETAHRIVVVGNGMVGHRFLERIAAREDAGRFAITVIGEEARRAYDRVNLSAFFNTRQGYPEEFALNNTSRPNGAGTATILLDPVGSTRLPNYANVDLHLDRPVKLGTVRFVPSMDVFNLTNGNIIQGVRTTQNASNANQVQAIMANPGGKLRPGMFVEVEVGVGEQRTVFPMPASAISYAPFGDSVFLVTDLKSPSGETYRGVRQQFVKVEGSRGDQVAVVSGVKAGDEVVSSGVFKLRNGAAVTVNNKVQPENNPAPKPQDS